MRFLVRFTLWLLLAASLPLALGLGLLTSYAALAARVAQPNFGLYGGVVALPLTPGRFCVLQLGLAAVAGGAALGLGLVRRLKTPPKRPASGRRSYWRGVGAALWRPVRQLSRPERILATGVGLAVVAARLYYAGWYPLSLDEIASYDYCVLPGPAITASYYPFPNNHILPNLLVGLVHGLLPGASPLLALRLLPTLAGVLTLPVGYALLLRHLRYWGATLGLGWFLLSPLSVYYAVAGRGYAWALLAALAGLLAALELLRPGGPPVATRRLAWAVFGLSGVMGLYAVPSHLYVLMGLGVSLLVGFGRQAGRQRWLNLGYLAVISLGIGLASAVLYGPVGAVSGWPALLANRYVARHEWPEFQVGFGPFLVGTATELLGQRGLSAAAYAGLVLLAPVALTWGRLPAPARRLGWLLYAQLVVWLPLAAVQGVYPPARTLLAVLLAFFLLLPLSAEALLARWGPSLALPRFQPWASLAGLALLLLGYSGYRLAREQSIIAAQTQQEQGLRRAYAWLRTQPLRRIWVEPRAYAILWQHFALRDGQPPLPLMVVDDNLGTQPGPVGEVEVLKAPPAPPRPTQPPLYQSAQMTAVPVSPTQPLLVFP